MRSACGVTARILLTLGVGSLVLWSRIIAQDISLLKDFGTRYEGLFDRPNASPSLDVLGFFARDGELSYESRNLKVEFFLPEGEQAFIEAHELDPQGDYLMKSKPSGIQVSPSRLARFSDWAVKDILEPNRINPGRLGVVVRLQSDRRYLTPAVFYGDKRTGAKLDYRMYISFDQSLDGLRYELMSGDKTVSSCQVDPSRPEECLHKQQGFRIEASTVIPLKVDMSNFGPGDIDLRILAKYVNSREAILTTYRFAWRPSLF